MTIEELKTCEARLHEQLMLLSSNTRSKYDHIIKLQGWIYKVREAIYKLEAA